MKGKRSFSKKVNEMENAMQGAVKDPEILEAMQPRGYDESRIRTEGIDRLELVKTLGMDNVREYAEQYVATHEKGILYELCYDAYKPILKLTRIALKNDAPALKGLKATGSRNRSLSGFIDEATILYTNLLKQPQYMGKVGKFGITEDELRERLAEINELKTSYQAFLKEKGEAQNSTVERDAAFDELYDWYSDFRAVAQIALSHKPQLLEKMGIVVKR